MNVHFTSPSASCVNDALRSRAESQIQIRKNADVMPMNIFRFRKPDFFR